MKNIILCILFLLLFVALAFADNTNVQQIEFLPLSTSISFSTVSLRGTGWVTAPTVELRGRKEILINNIDDTNAIYVSGVSGSTIYGTIDAGQSVTFKASSDLHIYLSSNTVTTCEVWEIK